MKINRKIIPTPMGTKPFYVYEHLYPEGFIDDNGDDLSGIVFYVGKGKVVSRPKRQRIDHHEYDAADGGRAQKHNVIRSIWSKGMDIQKRVAFEFDEEIAALDGEMKHMQACMSPYLTNVSKGNKHMRRSTKRRKMAGIPFYPGIAPDSRFPTYHTFGEVTSISFGPFE